MAKTRRLKGLSLSRCALASLSSVLSEWLVIVLLFVNAALSYLAERLARKWKLKTPCIICSKMDSLFGNGNVWFYGDAVCSAHKMQISCLSYCQSHMKLVYTDDACQNCLLWSSSSAGKQEGHSELHSLTDMNRPAKAPLSQKCASSDSSPSCFCCGETMRRASNALRCRQPGIEISSGKPPRKMSCDTWDRSAVSDPLRNVGYRELNTNSDSETEESVLKVTSRSSHRGIVAKKLIHQVPMASASDFETQTGSSPPGDEDSNWSHHHMGGKIAAPSGPRTNTATSSTTVPVTASSELLRQKSSEGTGYPDCAGTISSGEASKDMRAARGVKPLGVDVSLTARILNDRNESLKRAIGSRVIAQSPKFSEMLLSRSHDDLRGAHTQVPTRAPDAWSETASSPRSMHIDESNLSDTSSSFEGHNASTKMPLERNNSNLEYYEPKVPKEGDEGEGSVSNLKRLVDLHKDSLHLLYKELEEERSASSIAASEAMAMITRLQEEKATMQMEALQYLRVMEEQSEYDREAIQRLNDLLTEREKEILDLEDELATYRSRFGYEEVEDIDARTSRPGKNFSLGFEVDRACILECLSKLESKLYEISENENSSKEFDSVTATNCKTPNGYHVLENGTHDASADESQCGEMLGERCSAGETVNCGSDLKASGEIKSLRQEIIKLRKRFEAIEQDQQFLERALRLIRDRDNGAQFIHEIAGYLQELRRITVER